MTAQVRRTRCNDRTMHCASCKSPAVYFVMCGDRIWFASCARHVEGHERRTHEFEGSQPS
jgi:hypothetical protein